MWWVALAAAVPRPGAIGEMDTGGPEWALPDAPEVPFVVGGEPVPVGVWDDAAGIVFDDAYVGCTGTLIAPDVVLTAAHCAGNITQVLIGSKNWAFDGDYEFIRVDRIAVHPSYDGGSGFDVAALKLRRPSAFPPRVVASDCVLEESLFDGATVTIVGFGNTQINGEGGTTVLRAAETRVVDHDCSENRVNGIITGCDPGLRPGGEIGAGGRLDLDGDGQQDGPRDACFGDSGGPLYLHADRGVFLVGVTSRAFVGADPDFPCRDGGIYARPDALIEWIENRMDTTIPAPQCNDAPTASIRGVRVGAGKSATEAVDFEDPEGTGFTVSVAGEPSLGTVTVNGGEVTFTAFPGAKGEETLTLLVTDGGSPQWPRSAPQTIEVPWTVRVGGGPCGCATDSSPLWLGFAGVFAFVRGRRRSADADA